jgi:hypothetical protein
VPFLATATCLSWWESGPHGSVMRQLTECLSRIVWKRRPALPDLDVRIACFREVLHANNAALGFLAGIQEAVEGERPLSAASVRRLVAGVTTQTYRMVSNLNRMTGDRYRAVLSRFHEIRTRVARRV